MPVYNEHATIADTIEDVLAVDLPDGVDLELVIVESNSTDGTRDAVRKYEEDPRVELVLQAEALGKGNAVREGFRHLTGDVVLIQDGDREYDVADYPKLLQPILDGEADFVLGSRHVAGEPLRVMPNAKMTSHIVNGAHRVFLTMFNVTYRTKLRDPFTMYKVFRRECIDGVSFVANRFDFDWEIVAKLKRLGYEPWEVPVSYQARSFHGGKKVRFLRDPPTWVAACIRFRVTPIHRD
jgi:glycosyltransferase involved in cell wall biosynthesis